MAGASAGTGGKWLYHCRAGSLEKLILVLIIFIYCRKGSLEKFVLNLLLNKQFPSIEGMNRINKDE
ncbi:hypothetical protein [Thiolapillus sp.]|uniref:hypothetical protein n=1 Tax=Thiolapillus sp. TaxID=2017437 RepID=UPI0025D310D1|nr:hypothetical protein [Thiolapillus sp.]